MLKTINGISLTANATHQPAMKQLLNRIIISAKKLLKPAPNEFNKRYAEKFTNPDHCQWQGGRLLNTQELKYITNRPKN